MTKNIQPFCRFVEVVERLPQCPCDCVPPIPDGPPCPFKNSSGEPVASTLQSLLKSNPNLQGSGCSLAENSNKNQPAGSSQMCVFSRPATTDFKSLPPYKCSCVQGTCPELAKNFIRSLGYDPMCTCPCPQTIKVEPEPEVEQNKKSKHKKKDKTKSPRSGSKIDIKAKDSNAEMSSTATSAMLGMSTSAAENAPTAGSAHSGGSEKPLPTENTEDLARSKIRSDHQTEKKSVNYSSGPSEFSNGSLLLEGKGFKIFEIDGEKVLFNYSTRNCHLLKCKCSQKDDKSCGCSEWIRLTKYKNCVCPGARRIKNTPKIILEFK